VRLVPGVRFVRSVTQLWMLGIAWLRRLADAFRRVAVGMVSMLHRFPRSG
jgi:hypothetical protein